MDDPHRTPGDKDRSQLAARIRAAHEVGLIGVADRDIRLGNVRGAQSMLELELMRRELDQVEASLSRMPAPVTRPGWTPPGGAGAPGAFDRTASRIIGVVFAVVFVLILSLVVAVFVLSGAVGLILGG